MGHSKELTSAPKGSAQPTAVPSVLTGSASPDCSLSSLLGWGSISTWVHGA